MANHPLLSVFKSAPEVRGLPSAGITRVQQYYAPVRLPFDPPPQAALKPRPPTRWVSPVTRITFPACRAHYPGGSRRVRVSIASPLTRPSPFCRRVGIRTSTFEACSGFTHVTARRIAQPPRGGLCHEASIRLVTHPNRSSATRAIDNSLGGSSLQW